MFYIWSPTVLLNEWGYPSTYSLLSFTCAARPLQIVFQATGIITEPNTFHKQTQKAIDYELLPTSHQKTTNIFPLLSIFYLWRPLRM